MSRSLENIRLIAQLTARLVNTLDSGQEVPATQGVDFTPDTVLSSGTGANQADRTWSSTDRALADTVSESIDLFDFAGEDIGAGAGNDAVGQALSLAEVVALVIVNHADSTGSLLVGGEGTAAAWNSLFNGSDTAQIGPFPPGSVTLIFVPTDPALAVADASNHLLAFEASGGDLEYDVHLLGRSS